MKMQKAAAQHWQWMNQTLGEPMEQTSQENLFQTQQVNVVG